MTPLNAQQRQRDIDMLLASKYLSVSDLYLITALLFLEKSKPFLTVVPIVLYNTTNIECVHVGYNLLSKQYAQIKKLVLVKKRMVEQVSKSGIKLRLMDLLIVGIP